MWSIQKLFLQTHASKWVKLQTKIPLEFLSFYMLSKPNNMILSNISLWEEREQKKRKEKKV